MLWRILLVKVLYKRADKAKEENKMNKKLFEEIKEGLDSLTEEMAEKLLNSVNSEKRDMLYRILWSQYVYNDFLERLEDREMDINHEDCINKVWDCVYRYVYCGDYDCTLPYWDNIDNIINDVFKL